MINNVVLMGRLTYEPELRTTPNGLSVISFQLACDRNYGKSDEERKTDFIDCQAWRSTAEFISRYFHKGDMLALTGSLQTNNYTDKNGSNRKAVTVVANNVSFCGSKSESTGANSAFSQPAPSYAAAAEVDFEEIADDDDFPF